MELLPPVTPPLRQNTIQRRLLIMPRGACCHGIISGLFTRDKKQKERKDLQQAVFYSAKSLVSVKICAKCQAVHGTGKRQ